jgi:ferredoxin-thioredoxin reductase catalytic subunit
MEARERIEAQMREDAKENGYFLCPDQDLLADLIAGLAVNQDRYGFGACPCRIASGIRDRDVDIICPCEYRDADCAEFGMCYCCLFVTDAVKSDPSKLGSIPERRPVEAQDAAMEALERQERGEEPSRDDSSPRSDSKNIQVWRCKVCGYLAARESPPPICPICKVRAEKFEAFPLCS